MILEMGHKKKSHKGKHRRRSSTGSNNSSSIPLYTDSGDESARLLTEENDSPSNDRAEKKDYSGVSLINSPLLYCVTLVKVIWQAIVSCFDFIKANWLAFTVATLFIITFA